MKDKAEVRSFFLILKDGSRSGPLCAWRETESVGLRSRCGRNTHRPKRQGVPEMFGAKLPYEQGGLRSTFNLNSRLARRPLPNETGVTPP